MSDRLVIVGAGGHGREALAVARAVDRARPAWHEIVLVDDVSVEDVSGADRAAVDAMTERLARIDARLVGDVESLIAGGDDYVVAIGDPDVRRRVVDRIGGGARAHTLVDPTAWMGDDVRLGEGALVFPGAICTTNVRIGRHTHLNCGVIVSHDCRLGDFVSCSPGVRLNGDVTVGDGAFLGTGAIVLPGRRVGQGAVVGAGAVVVDDVLPGRTVRGVPAR